jgi:hypothetical protein
LTQNATAFQKSIAEFGYWAAEADGKVGGFIALVVIEVGAIF